MGKEPEMGAKLVHFEITADDPDKLAEFYTAVLGWKIDPPVEEMGGQVVMEKMAVPKMGYMSVLLDPEGHPFGLWIADMNAA